MDKKVECLKTAENLKIGDTVLDYYWLAGKLKRKKRIYSCRNSFGLS